MIYTSLDAIIRRALLQNSMPIHWYAEYLFHSSSCLRELTIDTLKVINTKNLPIGDYGEVDLPDDYLDDIGVSFSTGATLKPIPHRDSINPLRIHNSATGDFERQPTTTTLSQGGLYFPFVGRTWYWNISDYSEPTGRLFGSDGENPNGYKVIKERRQIQLYGEFSGGNMVLQYISDGQSVDNASMVDTLAFQTIQDFINWQSGPNKNNEFSPEGKKYYNSKRKLRARLNDMTVEDIKNITRANYTAAIKN